MIGIFDCITQLKLRVDMQLPVGEQWQHVSWSLSSSAVDAPAQVPLVLSSSAVDEPQQQAPSILSSSAVNEPLQQVPPILAFDEDLDQVSSTLSSSSFNGNGPLQLVSSRLSSSARSASDRSSGSLASKSSWSSAAESSACGVSGGDFALDDGWDVVDDEETMVTPVRVKSTPMLL
jgi:hypothetical protein